jgi:AcrR family transcriptional regulator
MHLTAHPFLDSNFTSDPVPPLRKNSAATRARLIRAAERGFAELGFNGASLREITQRARVNLAAVSYHFSSKRELWLEVMQRRAEALSTRRLQMLDEARRDLPPGRPIPLEKIIEAFLLPMATVLCASPGSREVLTGLMTHNLTVPQDLRDEHRRRNVDPSLRVFRAAIREALPGIKDEELDWKFYFMVSSMFGTLARQGRQPGLDQRLNIENVENVMRRLASFVCAGLRAKPSGPADLRKPPKPSTGA